MTKTENYQLNQWDAADPIRREDFNADNAKLDAALSALQQTADSKADAEDVTALNETVAALAESMAVKNFAVGSYTGNSGTQTISLGFAPQMVYVYCTSPSSNISHRSALALQGTPITTNGTNLLELTTNGFTVIHDSNISVNYSIYSYIYIAVQ